MPIVRHASQPTETIAMKDIFFAVWLALAVTFVMESMTQTQAQTAADQSGTVSRDRTEPQPPARIGEFTTVRRDVGRGETKQDIKLSPSDQKFLQEAYERGLFETGAAQLALE